MTFVSHSTLLGRVRVARRDVIVRAYLSGSDSASDEGSDAENLQAAQDDAKLESSTPQALHLVMKAMKYLRTGDQTQCLVALACMEEQDLKSPYTLHCIAEDNGLEMLVNLLEVNDIRCRLGALLVFKEITKNSHIVRKVVDLGIVTVLVDRICENSLDIQALAATILSNVGYKRRASKAARRYGGIHLLVTLLNIEKELLIVSEDALSLEERARLNVARCAAHALWTYSKYSKNRQVMLSTGIVPFMSRILLSGNKEISYPMIGTLSECSSLVLFQLAIETEGLVGVLLTDMTDAEADVQRLCASALMRAAGGSEVVRDVVRFHGGLATLLRLLTTVDDSNTPLMAAIVGAIWKSAIAEANVLEYERIGAVPVLVEYLDSPHLDVRIMVLGALAEIAKVPSCRDTIISLSSIPKFIYMLGRQENDMQANAAHLMGEIAKNPLGMDELDKGDGVRLLWSLLQSEDRNVRLKALFAIKPCVMHAEDSGEVVRSITGAMGLLLATLQEEDIDVLVGACAVVAEVANDLENLAVLTEQGVVLRLCQLVGQPDEALRRDLARAIANCCRLPDNVRTFGAMNIIPTLATYLCTKSKGLLAQTCRALRALSFDVFNCVAMHSCGVVPFLLSATESPDHPTQMNAADCLANIRRLLHKADLRHDNYETRIVNVRGATKMRESLLQLLTRPPGAPASGSFRRISTMLPGRSFF